MKSIKCPTCGLVSFAGQSTCKRCLREFDFADGNQSGAAVLTTESPLKTKAMKKIKWGLVLSLVGFGLTFGAISLGVFDGFANTDREYLRRVRPFSLVTLLPLAAVAAGIIELAAGVSILDIIDKWEQLPSWLGWLIGISVFVVVVAVVLFVSAVVIFNFF